MDSFLVGWLDVLWLVYSCWYCYSVGLCESCGWLGRLCYLCCWGLVIWLRCLWVVVGVGLFVGCLWIVILKLCVVCFCYLVWCWSLVVVLFWWWWVGCVVSWILLDNLWLRLVSCWGCLIRCCVDCCWWNLLYRLDRLLGWIGYGLWFWFSFWLCGWGWYCLIVGFLVLWKVGCGRSCCDIFYSLKWLDFWLVVDCFGVCYRLILCFRWWWWFFCWCYRLFWCGIVCCYIVLVLCGYLFGVFLKWCFLDIFKVFFWIWFDFGCVWLFWGYRLCCERWNLVFGCWCFVFVCGFCSFWFMCLVWLFCWWVGFGCGFIWFFVVFGLYCFCVVYSCLCCMILVLRLLWLCWLSFGM